MSYFFVISNSSQVRNKLKHRIKMTNNLKVINHNVQCVVDSGNIDGYKYALKISQKPNLDFEKFFTERNYMTDT